MPTLSRGILIALEGIDGSGKTVLADLLFKSLAQISYAVLLTKEPGGSQLGKEIRALLKEKTISMTAKAQYLLFAADRAQHFHEVVIPALRANKIVISDRMADSSIVYQGYAHGVDHAMIKNINQWTMEGIEPDLIFYVKLEVTVAQERKNQRQQEDAFDKESTAYFNKITHGYETEFANRSNVVTLDGNLTAQALTEQAVQYLESWIQKNNLHY